MEKHRKPLPSWAYIGPDYSLWMEENGGNWNHDHPIWSWASDPRHCSKPALPHEILNGWWT
jgi:hypothetical protein